MQDDHSIKILLQQITRLLNLKINIKFVLFSIEGEKKPQNRQSKTATLDFGNNYDQ